MDVLFKLPPEVYRRFELRQGNKQSQLLQEIKGVLLASFPRTDIKGDGPVVVVPFASFAVELLPAFLLESGKFWIPITTAGGSYKVVDPDSELQSLKASSDATNGNIRPLIRMAKCWQGVCSVPIKSYWLELLAIEFLNSYQYKDKSETYYDWMIRDFFKFLVSRANTFVYAPGTYEPMYLGDAWKSRAETARDRAIRACDYESANMPASALFEWVKIFGGYVA